MLGGEIRRNTPSLFFHASQALPHTVSMSRCVEHALEHVLLLSATSPLHACTAGNSNFEFAEARLAVEVTNTTPLFRTYLPAHSETPHMPHTHMAVDWVIQLAVTIVYPDHCPRMCANSRKQFCMQHARDGRKSHTNDSKSPPHMHQSRNYHEGVLRCQ